MNDPVLGFLGILVGAILTFLGVRFTARQSRKAADAASAVASRQVDVSEWQAIVAELRAEIRRLNERVDRVVQDRADERSGRLLLLAYARELLTSHRRNAPDVEPPTPPALYADELAYFTER